MWFSVIWCFLILVGNHVNALDDEGHCIWYSKLEGSNFNDFYNGTAKLLSEETSINTLLKRCPDIYKSSKIRYEIIPLDYKIKLQNFSIKGMILCAVMMPW